MKTCKKCGLEKELSEFSPTSVYKGEIKHRAECKSCNAEDARRRRENPDERHRQVLASRDWKLRNPEKVSAQCRRRMYGISDETFKDMFRDQQGKCPICGILLAKTCKANTPFVDHDHTTKKVRGILCRSCNFGLGLFKDDLANLIKAAEYIRTKS